MITEPTCTAGCGGALYATMRREGDEFGELLPAGRGGGEAEEGEEVAAISFVLEGETKVGEEPGGGRGCAGRPTWS